METENILTNQFLTSSPNEEIELMDAEDAFSLIDNEHLRYGFRIGNIGFIYNTDLHSEVINSIPISPIPNTPPWMHGLINLRGSLVPVFDLAKYLQLEIKNNKNKLLLILDKGEHAVAVMINEYPQLLKNLNKSSEIPSLPSEIQHCVISVFEEEQLVWYEIDKTNFFTTLGKTVIS